MVFPEALLGSPDCPDQPAVQIHHPPRKIQPLARDRVVVHGIDREVTPHRILLGIVGVGNLVRPTSIAVAAFPAKRRHLGECVAVSNKHHAEALAHAARPSEDTQDLLRQRVGYHVAILDRSS